MVWSISAAYVMTLRSCGSFPGWHDPVHCSTSVCWEGGVSWSLRERKSKPPRPHPGCLFLWLVLICIPFTQYNSECQDSAFLGHVSRSGGVLNLREGCTCICMHAHTLLVKDMKMFLCTVFSELPYFIFHKDLQYWNRFLWIMYEPSFMYVGGFLLS